MSSGGGSGTASVTLEFICISYLSRSHMGERISMANLAHIPIAFLQLPCRRNIDALEICCPLQFAKFLFRQDDILVLQPLELLILPR
jgi:hypothetical protein